MTARTPCAACRGDGILGETEQRDRHDHEPRLIHCTVCAGDGFLDEVGPPRCEHCDGDGENNYREDGGYMLAQSCLPCSGTGLGSQWLPPNLWHPARYFVVDGVALTKGLVFVDHADQPRFRRDVEAAEDLPADWLDMIAPRLGAW